MCYLKIKQFLQKKLTPAQIKILRRILYFISPLFSNNIILLALICGTDKFGVHNYVQHYQKHFHSLRKKKLNILEIGVGGYKDPKKGAASLRMWKRYFPKSMIYSIDVYDKSALQEQRIRIFKGNQTDEAFLKNICSEIGPLDIIIDDGNHFVSHVLTSFKILFPFLKEGGVYVIEDTQTSYWPDYGGNSENLNDPSTSMNFFKNLTDGLNYQEFLKPDYVSSYFDRNIVAIHFYHNLVFIYKSKNDGPRNMIMGSDLDSKH